MLLCRCKNKKQIKNILTLYQFCSYEPNNIKTDSKSFKSKTKFLVNTNKEGIINYLKYLTNFWRTIQMPLINCEINFLLTSSANCVISQGNRVTTLQITYRKLYVPVVTLSNQDNT